MEALLTAKEVRKLRFNHYRTLLKLMQTCITTGMVQKGIFSHSTSYGLIMYHRCLSHRKVCVLTTVP